VLGFAGWLLGASVQKRENANLKLRQINHSLDSLIHKITHDLRSPAAKVKGLVQIIHAKMNAGKDDEIPNLINMIDQSTDKWLETFAEFVDILRKEKEGIREVKQCDLTRIVSEVAKSLQVEVANSNAKIDFDFNACNNAYASPFDLTSIFKNLISNAIKYAHPDRRPEIYIQSIINGQMAMVQIEDNGICIDLDKHGDHLFQLFHRINNNPEIEGTGVGLYLVKDQIEKNGGTIQVESTLGKGTTFTFTLPI
jgi:light-regulated signal transduction histidine kinase (bacteriophytochrome)